jgi:hypothetical protein
LSQACKIAAVALSLCAISKPQTAPPKERALSYAVPSFEVKLSTDPNFNVPYPDTMPVISKQCGLDGSPYVWVVGPSGYEAIGLIGKSVVSFATDRMQNIPEPSAVDFFVNGSGVYVLVRGVENSRKELLRLKLPDDETGTQLDYWQETGDSKSYIARFAHDASYKGALKLDVDFQVGRIAAFESGSLLIAGTEGKEPRLAMLDAMGQNARFLELPKAKRKTQHSSALVSSSSNDSSASMDAMFSQFYPYRDDILFVRGGSRGPIYEIEEAGGIRAVELREPMGYVIDHMIPSDANWFVSFRRSTAAKDASEQLVYEIDPINGKLLRSFQGKGYETENGVDLSCVYRGEFSAVVHRNGRIMLLHGAPEAAVSLKDR